MYLRVGAWQTYGAIKNSVAYPAGVTFIDIPLNINYFTNTTKNFWLATLNSTYYVGPFSITHTSPLPTISSITPSTVTLNQAATFTVTGSNLTSTMAMYIPECNGMLPLGGSATSQRFSCTPSFTAGNKVSSLKDKAGGTVVRSFTVTVNPPLPTISSITPSTVTLNQAATFTVTGSNLTSTMAMYIPECNGMLPLGGSATSQRFSCTPSFTAGNKVSSLKDKAGGTVVRSFTVTVNPPLITYLNTSTFAQPAAHYMVTNGIVSDPINHDLRGTANASHVEVATMIYRALGGGMTNADTNFTQWAGGIIPSTPFADVRDPRAWYYNAVSFMASLAYQADTTGTTVFNRNRGLFTPAAPIIRAWTVKALLEAWNIAPLTQAQVNALPAASLFNDVPRTHPAAGYIYKAKQLGIVQGNTTANTFSPDVYTVRQDIFIMLHNIMDATAATNNVGTVPAKPTPATQDFINTVGTPSIGVLYAQPTLYGVVPPTVSILPATITMTKDTTPTSPYFGLYTAVLDASIVGGSLSHTDPVTGVVTNRSLSCKWSADSGTFVDQTPIGATPFSRVLYIAASVSGNSTITITLEVGDDLSSMVPASKVISLTAATPQAGLAAPILGFNLRPGAALTAGTTINLVGTATDQIPVTDSNYGIRAVLVGYSLDNGVTWQVAVSNLGVDTAGGWTSPWSVPDVVGAIQFRATASSVSGKSSLPQSRSATITRQNIISGNVVNSLGSPLANATINLTGAVTASVVSDNQGMFQFNTGLVLGSYSLTASIGAATSTAVTTTLTAAQNQNSVTIPLDQEPPVLAISSNVTTTAATGSAIQLSVSSSEQPLQGLPIMTATTAGSAPTYIILTWDPAINNWTGGYTAPATAMDVTFNVSGTDMAGNIGNSQPLIVTVAVNNPPVISLPGNPYSLAILQGQSATIAITANDPDGDLLTYTLAGTPVPQGQATVDAINGTVNYTAANAAGTDTVVVNVDDGRGGITSLTINITIQPVVIDSDNDGVPDGQDAFPQDPAASVDGDKDGSPEQWNTGKSAANSNSIPPLHIDAFPLDAAASVDSDKDGFPDAWNANSTVSDQVASRLLLDMSPQDPAVALIRRDLSSDSYALAFDGVNNFVRIPSFGTFTTFSVDASIRRTGATTTREEIVSYKEGLPNNCGFVLSLNEGNNGHRPRLFVQVNGVWKFAEAATSIALNRDVHLSGSYDGTSIKLYVDGRLAATTPAIGAMTQCTQFTAIGGRATGTSNLTNNSFWHFPGDIDEVRIWRTPRTQAQIQADMYASLAGNEAGLVGYWRFNEGNGTTVKDATGNGNNGVLGAGVVANQPQWVAATRPYSGIVVDYPLDGYANDVSGNGIHGAIVGNVTFSPSPNNKAASFPGGSGSGIDFPSNKNLNPNAALTVETWVNIPSIPTNYSNNKIIKNTRFSSPWGGYWLQINPINSPVGYTAGAASLVIADTTATYAAIGTTALSLNTWHHIVGTFDGGKVSIYLDGVLEATAPVPTNFKIGYFPSGNSFTIGHWFGTTFLGQVRHARIYNKALSTVEVKGLASQGNQPPVINAPVDPYSLTVQQGQTANFILGASDANGDALSYTIATQGAVGNATITPPSLNPNVPALVQYVTTQTTPIGTDSFVVQVDDGKGGVATLAVNVNVVAPPNQPPVANNDVSTFNTSPGTGLITTNVLLNDSDPNGDALTVSAFTQPANGRVAVAGVGVFSYTPNVGFAGVDTFNYTVSDGRGGAASAQVRITLLDNTKPSVIAPANITVAATNATGTPAIQAAIATFLGGATASDNIGLVGTVINNAPAAFPIGTTTVVFTATDTSGNKRPATATVTVNAVSTVPNVIMNNGALVTLSAPAGTNIFNVASGVSPLAGPAGISFPTGTLAYSMTSPVGGAATMTLTFAGGLPLSFNLYKVNNLGAVTLMPTTTWVRVGSSIQITLIDGGMWDLDGLANGVIVDPIAIGVDTQAPVITFKGAANLTVAQGGVFTDPGATVTDNVDVGLVTTATGIVDVYTVSVYTVTYNVSDSYGNAATPVTRTVNVVDQTAPVITSLGTNPYTVTIGSIYVDAGATALDNVDGNLTSSILVNNLVNTSTLGTYTVTYNVTDAANNVATQVTRTVNVVAQVLPPSLVQVADVYGRAGGNVNVPLAIEPYTGVSIGSFNISVQFDGSWLTAGVVSPQLPASWFCSQTLSPPSPFGLVSLQLACSTAAVADTLSTRTVIQLPFSISSLVPVGITSNLTLANTSALYDASNILLNATWITGSITVNNQTVIYQLVSGWNLIAFPVDLGPIGLADFMTAVPDANEIWSYANGAWSSYITSVPSFLNSLKALQPLTGYWVKIAAGKNPTANITGTPVSGQAALQAAAWNMIGISSVVNDLATYTTTQGATEVWGYSNGNWCSFSSSVPVFLNCLTAMQPEAGYYVKKP